MTLGHHFPIKRLLTAMAYVRLPRIALLVIFTYSWMKSTVYYPLFMVLIAINEVLGLEYYISSMVSSKTAQKYRFFFLILAICVFLKCDWICNKLVFDILNMDKDKILMSNQEAFRITIQNVYEQLMLFYPTNTALPINHGKRK